MPTRFSAVATDLEFVKTGGKVLARSAAFVPFAARSALSLSALGGIPCTASTPVTGNALCCVFPSAPTVLSVAAEEVLKVADVLPCGHVLLPHLQRALVSGEALEQLKSTYASEASDAWEAFRLLQKDLRVHSDRQTPSASPSLSSEPSTNHTDGGNIINDEEESELTSSESSASCAPTSRQPKAASRTSRALSPQEVALRRQFQIRAAIPRFYEVLDPYGVPNISRLDVAACRALYTEEVASSGFGRAARAFSPFRAYGRGKGKQKALAHLLRYYPEFAQQILRHSFASSEAWIAFLRDSRDIVQRELERVQEEHRRGSTALSLPLSTLWPVRGGSCAVGGPGGEGLTTRPSFQFVESPSFHDFSLRLNHTWAAHLYGQPQPSPHAQREPLASSAGCKFFAYGAVDGPVLQATLHSSCEEYNTQHFSVRAARAGGGGGALSLSTEERRGSGDTTHKSRFLTRRGDNGRKTHQNATEATLAPSATRSAVSMSPVPQDALVSPFQAKLVDITQHTLFRASGFCASSKKVPSLSTALERLVEKDPVAAGVWEVRAPHDPLWDAQALACVCVGCGVVQ